MFWFGVIPLASPVSYLAMAAILGAAAFAARKVTNASANRSGPEIVFEESASGELVGLNLNV